MKANLGRLATGKTNSVRDILANLLRKCPFLWNTVRVMLLKGYPIVLEFPINPKPRYGYGKPPHPILYAVINRNRMTYQNYLISFLNYKDYFLRIPKVKSTNPREPYWCNRWLPPLDAVALYSLLALNDPRRYIEIGSGNSTKFARRAINDHHLQTKIISIDSRPRAKVSSICDENIRQQLENVNLDIFYQLEAGDILFIDGSHTCFTNSDVCVIFLEIMPRLSPGVLVEFHDVLLPYDYPPVWRYRYYSEQYLLAIHLLLETDKFEILLPNAFIDRDAELRTILSPTWDEPIMGGLQIPLQAVMKGVEMPEASFWIRIK